MFLQLISFLLPSQNSHSIDNKQQCKMTFLIKVRFSQRLSKGLFIYLGSNDAKASTSVHPMLHHPRHSRKGTRVSPLWLVGLSELIFENSAGDARSLLHASEKNQQNVIRSDCFWQSCQPVMFHLHARSPRKQKVSDFLDPQPQQWRAQTQSELTGTWERMGPTLLGVGFAKPPEPPWQHAPS